MRREGECRYEPDVSRRLVVVAKGNRAGEEEARWRKIREVARRRGGEEEEEEEEEERKLCGGRGGEPPTEPGVVVLGLGHHLRALLPPIGLRPARICHHLDLFKQFKNIS